MLPLRGTCMSLLLVTLAAAGTAACADESNGTVNRGGPSPTLRVTQVVPNAGPTDSPVAVRILGSGFANGATLSVDGSPVNATIVSASEITATIPPHAAGRVDIVVTNPNGESTRLTGGYTYVALTVTSVLPASGFANTFLTIQGAGFVAGTTVTIGGVAAQVRVLSSVTLSVTTPAHDAGTVDVVVANPSGSAVTVASAFRYIVINLTASPASVTAGGDLTVNWSDTGGGDDWIGLFKVGDPNESYGWWEYVGGGAGTRTVSAPLVPGQYEFRYLPNDGFVDVARSNQVTVTPAASPASAPAVSVARRRLSSRD